MSGRSVRIVLVFLLLGLVATWAVAWASALIWTPRSNSRSAIEPNPPYRGVWEDYCPGGVAVTLQIWATAQDVQRAGRGPDSVPVRELVPIARATLMPSPGFGRGQQLMIEGRGWPWHAVWCKIEDSAAADFEAIPPSATISGAFVAAESEGGSRPAKLLPYFPYLPGLIGDTLLYAFAFSVPLQIGEFRRWRRGKWGHCRRCGYDLAGITGRCPECGRKQ